MADEVLLEVIAHMKQVSLLGKQWVLFPVFFLTSFMKDFSGENEFTERKATAKLQKK